METYIIVLPYQETSRLFTASRTVWQDAFVGENQIVYYKSQAKKFDSTAEAKEEMKKYSGNVHAFIQILN